jgi:hypothetical protein
LELHRDRKKKSKTQKKAPGVVHQFSLATCAVLAWPAALLGIKHPGNLLLGMTAVGKSRN